MSLKGHLHEPEGGWHGSFVFIMGSYRRINYVLDVCGCVYVCLLSATRVTMSIIALCFAMSDAVNNSFTPSVGNMA